MTNNQKNAAENCFVCGTKNPIGLNIKFKLSEEKCVGSFTPTEYHVGFYNIIHGGLLFAVLDDAMANWFYLQGSVGYTARAEVRYKRPLLVGETALVSCHLVQKKGSLLLLKSEMTEKDSKKIIAESEGKFLIEKSL